MKSLSNFFFLLLVLPLVFATSGNIAPETLSERHPASSADEAALFWRDLYAGIRNLENEVARRTRDVSSFEEADENGNPKPRTKREIDVLELRNQIEHLKSKTKKHGKRAQQLSGAEIQSFLEITTQQLESWNTHPVIRSLPSSVDEALRSIRDLLVTRQDISPLQERLSALFPKREMTLTFNTANHVCAMVSAPGNIILRKALLMDGKTDNDFGPKTMNAINLIESLKGGDKLLNYRHSELISQIENYNNIETISYYPWYFDNTTDRGERLPMFMIMNKTNGEYFSYRSKYSAFRVRAARFDLETERRESALSRLDARVIYHRMGTCADFVNWTFFNTITSSWNQIPIIKNLIQLIYPPETVQTPDNLADSPDTEKICEVEYSRLIFPAQIDAKDWLSRLKTDLNSKKPAIRDHAGRVWDFLLKRGVVDAEGNRKAEVVRVETRRF